MSFSDWIGIWSLIVGVVGAVVGIIGCLNLSKANKIAAKCITASLNKSFTSTHCENSSSNSFSWLLIFSLFFEISSDCLIA